MNSKYLIGIVVLIVIVVGGFMLMKGGNQAPAPASAPAQQNSGQNAAPTSATSTGKNMVTIQSYAFSPAALTVKVGDKVTWTNQDAVGHSAVADDKSFDTGIIAQGQSGSVTFSKAGTFAYHCSVHPMMKATITVQ